MPIAVPCIALGVTSGIIARISEDEAIPNPKAIVTRSNWDAEPATKYNKSRHVEIRRPRNVVRLRPNRSDTHPTIGRASN